MKWHYGRGGKRAVLKRTLQYRGHSIHGVKDIP